MFSNIDRDASEYYEEPVEVSQFQGVDVDFVVCGPTQTCVVCCEQVDILSQNDGPVRR